MSPDSLECEWWTLVANMSWRRSFYWSKQIVAFPPASSYSTTCWRARRATQKKCDFRSFSIRTGPATSRLWRRGGIQLYKIGFLRKIQPGVMTALPPLTKTGQSIISRKLWSCGCRVAPFHNLSDVGDKNWVQLEHNLIFIENLGGLGMWSSRSQNWNDNIHQLSIFRPQSDTASIFLKWTNVASIFKESSNFYSLNVFQFLWGPLVASFLLGMFWKSKTWMTATCFGRSHPPLTIFICRKTKQIQSNFYNLVRM